MGEEEEHSLIAVGRGAHGSCCGRGYHSAGGGSGSVPVLRWEHAIVHAQLEVATCRVDVRVDGFEQTQRDGLVK